MIISLTSAADPRVSDYTSLTDVALRRSKEAANGLYLAESSRVLRRALAAGHQPRSFFLAEKWLPDLADVLAEYPDIPAFVGSPGVLEEITGFHLHRGAMAAMNRPPAVSVVDVLSQARRIAILENVVDHTNLGAIFRSAAALEVDGILVTPECGDPLYRRSIRVSMGTVFKIPWARLSSWPDEMDLVKSHGFTTAALALSDDATDLDAFAGSAVEKLALILGTEGEGLAAETVTGSDVVLKIPMRGGVDSLNVAAASAVAFWQCRPSVSDIA